MTGEKDPRDVMQAEHDAGLSEHPAFRAPAEMPGVEEIARAIASWRHRSTPANPYRPSILPSEMAQASAVIALFAPTLAEKERRDALDREQAETARFLQHHLDNPQPPSEALKKLFADYQASGVQSVGLDSPFNACCHREECRALEARALAAEAALAAERERCAKIAEETGFRTISADIAAAIRAQE